LINHPPHDVDAALPEWVKVKPRLALLTASAGANSSGLRAVRKERVFSHAEGTSLRSDAAAFSQQSANFRRWNGSTEKGTLNFGTSLQTQLRKLIGRLNAFGRRGDTKALTETCHGPHDCGAVGAF
jgi:hypothetical protein